MNAPEPVTFMRETPQPLVREIPRGTQYPVDALGPLIVIVEAVQAATQAPAAIAAQSALSVASLAVQAFGNVETLAGSVPVSLYCLTIAQSGERKSACDKLVMAELRDFEHELTRDYREDMADWSTAHKLWTAKRDRMIKDASGSHREKAQKAEEELGILGAEPAQPLSPKLTAGEPTLEGLLKLFISGQPSIGLFSDEGGGFLGGHAMNSDNRLKTVAGLSCLWGGEPIDRVRAGDGATTLYGRRLSVHLMVQPVVARALLSDPVTNGQGFLARFLITEPPSAIGTRLRKTDPEQLKVAEGAGKVRLSEILAQAKPCSKDNPQELAPRTLTLSSGARELLCQYYEVTEREQSQGGLFEHIKSFASKSPEQAARIGGVLTLWGDLKATEVCKEVMADAIVLAQFYLFEAKRLVEVATVSDEVARAEMLRVWIYESWPKIALARGRTPSTIVPKDIVDFGPNCMRETATVKKLMKVLADHAWLVPLEPGAHVDGQARRLAYRIEPRT